MDMHDLWNDDPESLFLELGFGRDESDLSARIPVRFINFQSQANGMSLQVFLEAQRNRLDLENPDVSCRFRQVEVFHQVTTAFLKAPQRSDLPPEVLARRRHIGALFRRLARRSLSQVHERNNQDTTLLPAGSPPSGLPPSKIHQEELKPDHKEMIDCGSVATERTALKPPEEVLAVIESPVGVLILPNCQPHTQASSSSPSPTADVNAPPPSPPSSLGGLLSFDCPPSPLCHLSSPDGNYLEIPALIPDDASYSLAATSSSVRLVGSETANPQSPSAHPHISDLDEADSPSSRHPPTRLPANPEISSSSGNVSASESGGMWGASQGKPAFATGCQESAGPQRATYVAYYSISHFCYPSVPVVAPLNEPFLKESSENTADEDPSDNSDNSDQSEFDLPDDISDSPKGSDLPADVNVTQTAGLNTESSNCPSEAFTVISEDKQQRLTVSDKQSLERKCLSSRRRSSDSEQRLHDSPDVMPTLTLSSVWDLAEESSCDPDCGTWLDGPAGVGEVLLSAVLGQADTEGFAYWAEPVQVSVSSPVDEDSSCCKSPGDTQHVTAFVKNNATPFPDTPSSFIFDPLPLRSAEPSLKFSSCSLPSTLSSHIAHRRDVPLATRSTSSVLSGHFALDTSTPFRAVQSWTELQIQRHAAAGAAARRTAGRANDCAHSRKVWRRQRQTAAAASRCVCGHRCNQERDSEKQERPLAELQEMTRCLHHYCTVFRSVEEHLCEEQTESYQLLSEQDRRTLSDIEALRQAVKEEAGSLQTQLDELVCHYDQSLRQKMQRLLDEQSHSCSQLRVSVAQTLSHAHSRSVASQCCLLPRRHCGGGHPTSPEGRQGSTPESHFLNQTSLKDFNRDVSVWPSDITDGRGSS